MTARPRWRSRRWSWGRAGAYLAGVDAGSGVVGRRTGPPRKINGDKREREMAAPRFSGSKVSPEKWHGGDLVRWVSGVLLTLTRLSTTWQETALQRWGTNWHRPATEEFAIWSRRSRECRGLNRASQTHSCISRPKIYTSRNRHFAD